MAKVTWRDIASAAIDLTPTDFLRGGVTIAVVIASAIGTVATVTWSLSSKATELTSKLDDHGKQLAELTQTVKSQTSEAQSVRDRVVWIEARCCEPAAPPAQSLIQMNGPVGQAPTPALTRTHTASQP